MKKSLAVGIMSLFIVSSVTPMVIGYDAGDTLRDKDLENLAFACSDRYGSSKLTYYQERLLWDYSNDDVEPEEVMMPVESPPTAVSSTGPMSSAWPMICHDNRHTGRSPYSTADNPGDEIWRFHTDGWVDDTPVIDSDGTIYIGEEWSLNAIYPNGTLKWEYKTGGLISGSSPAIAEDGTIYVGTWDCKLYAIFPNGTLKWKVSVGGSIASSPAIAEDGTIYLGALGGFEHGGYIVAVSPNGTLKWRYETGDDIYEGITSNPAIGDDGTVYIGSGDNYLYAMYPNGTLRWRFKTGDEIHGHPSVAQDGTIYIGSWDDYLYALYPNGTMKWKFKTTWGTSGNPSIGNDGIVYVGSDKLYAVYPNGTLKWSFDLGPERHIAESSPAISADGTIYVGTNIGEVSGGDIIAINPNGTEKWRKRIAYEWVDSSPSIAEDGTVYIGSAYEMGRGYLHAFNRAELEAHADGPEHGLINVPDQFNGSASGGYPPYSWHWDFGDETTSTEQNPTHSYTNPGNFTVMLTVTDDEDNTSSDTIWIYIQETNSPPNTPTIDGPTSGKVDTICEYTFSAIDPDGNDVYFYIEWGDDTNSGWIGSYDSGEKITKSHKWSEKGNYTIRAKAKDVFDEESDWGYLEVIMPKNKIINPFERFLENHPHLFPLLRQLLGL